MLQNLAFCLFLFFIQPISSENYPWESVLQEMGTFAREFKEELKNFDKMIAEIGGKNKAEFLGQQFVGGMFEKGFINKIEKMRKEVGKYLQGKTSLGAIFIGLNDLRLDRERLGALEALKLKFDELKRSPQHQFFMPAETSSSGGSSSGSVMAEKQPELVDTLFGMRESVNKFAGETFVKLHLREMLEYLRGQKTALADPYGDQLDKYSPESFQKIANFINKEKSELRLAFNNPNPPLGANVNEVKLPQICDQNRQKLRQALAQGNPLSPILEKVELAALPQTELSRPKIVKINMHFAEIVDRLNGAVERMQKMIGEDNVFVGKQVEFADLHEKFDGVQLLNTACVRMYNRICAVVANKVPEEIKRNANLADIQWLGEYIEEMLDRMNEEYVQEMLAQMSVPDHPPPLNMAAAKEAKELPRELELNARKMGQMGTKEWAAVIAQNMLFMAGQMDQIYNLELAVDNLLMSRPLGGGDRETRIEEMINPDKELPPKQFGQFIFQKYMQKAVQANQAAGGSSVQQLKGKRRTEIGQQSVAGGQPSKHVAGGGGSSSAAKTAQGNVEGDVEEDEWVFI